jgi:hypothetical protein
VLYPLSYEGGGFESVSARIAGSGPVPFRARIAGLGSAPGVGYVALNPAMVIFLSAWLPGGLRLVYLWLIFNDKGGRYVVSLGPWRRHPAPRAGLRSVSP